MLGLLTAVVIAAAVPFYSQAAPIEQTEAKNIVVVLDPGHGGSAQGGQIPGVDEKNINLFTALAMKAELEKYEGITVYMTRCDDTALSLAQRAQFAAEVQADFLFSLHYNKSELSNLYGAEVWLPSLGENYSKAYACGDMVLNELCDHYGLYRRGLKTRLNAQGMDYYGVIRHATELGIPSMIIEHCHMDHPEDVPYFNSPEKLQQLGKCCATGVAKYFGLSSDLLGVDYSEIPKTSVAAPSIPVMQDVTPPETAKIFSVHKESGKLRTVLKAKDQQSPILYYDYSLDGGSTWSALQKWENSGMEKTVLLPASGSSLSVRVYNQYDLFTQSETVPIP